MLPFRYQGTNPAGFFSRREYNSEKIKTGIQQYYNKRSAE
jgi:hypothetical protein